MRRSYVCLNTWRDVKDFMYWTVDVAVTLWADYGPINFDVHGIQIAPYRSWGFESENSIKQIEWGRGYVVAKVVVSEECVNYGTDISIIEINRCYKVDDKEKLIKEVVKDLVEWFVDEDQKIEDVVIEIYMKGKKIQ